MTSDPSSQPTQPLTDEQLDRLGELMESCPEQFPAGMHGLYAMLSRSRAELRNERERLNEALAENVRRLGEITGLRTELRGCRNLGVEYERLRVENIALADKLTAVRAIKPRGRDAGRTAIELAEANGWNDAVNAIREAVEPCTCSLTDPATWETHGGATEPGSMYQWEPDFAAHGDPSALDQSGEGQANG